MLAEIAWLVSIIYVIIRNEVAILYLLFLTFVTMTIVIFVSRRLIQGGAATPMIWISLLFFYLYQMEVLFFHIFSCCDYNYISKHVFCQHQMQTYVCVFIPFEETICYGLHFYPYFSLKHHIKITFQKNHYLDT